jgi:hypothetical protein
MRILILSCVLVVALVAVAPAAQADDVTTHPGLFFTITNGCSSTVSGFAVGDKLCLLQVELATYTRAVFQGDLAAGQSQFAMACTASDGLATVLFVPPVSSGAQAVEMRVKPNETVKVPSTFCPSGDAAPESQFQGESEMMEEGEMMMEDDDMGGMMDEDDMDEEGMDG